MDEGKSPATALALMRALAMNESQAVTYKTLARDMSLGEAAPDDSTIKSYLELFERLKLTEDSRWLGTSHAFEGTGAREAQTVFR